MRLKLANAAHSPQQVELVGSVFASGLLLLPAALPVVVTVVVVLVASRNVEEGLSVLARAKKEETSARDSLAISFFSSFYTYTHFASM